MKCPKCNKEVYEVTLQGTNIKVYRERGPMCSKEHECKEE